MDSETKVIDGKTAITSEVFFDVLKKLGYESEWLISTDTEAKLKVTDSRGKSLEVSYTIAQADKAGLLGRFTWAYHPKKMLQSKAVQIAGKAFEKEIACSFRTKDMGD